MRIARGESVPAALLDRLRSVAEGPAPNTFEVESAGRIYELRVVALAAFESINLYGSDVTAERERHRLLLNILPAETAEELKANGRARARSYQRVTVMFSDFKDFTSISEHLTPEELVSFLYREMSFPQGAILLTGTGIIPPDDFTLHAGDEIAITIEAITSVRSYCISACTRIAAMPV